MKIELKKIQVYERMSQETTAFSANIYIDGKHVGDADNQGCGGPTDYHPLYSDNEAIRKKYRDAITKAEEYCKGLPAIKYDTFEIASDLENMIDSLLEAHLDKLQQQKIQRKTKNAILYGNENEYRIITYKHPLEAILMSPKGKAAIKEKLAELKKKYPQYELLNKNIPAELLPA